jgi:hypothetical protein
MSDHDWEEQFEELTSGLGGLVGQGEIAARQFFGDEQFEGIIDHANHLNHLTLRREAAQVAYLRSLAGLYKSLSITLLSAAAIGLAWSMYSWILN